MSNHIVVQTTAGDRNVADQLARSAVEARVAACAQVDGPIVSTYRWDGAVQTEAEWRVSFKTPSTRFDALRDHITAIHPYEVPEIITIDIVGGDHRYLTWLDAETAPQ